MNLRLIFRWYRENPKVSQHNPRSIQVGVPVDHNTNFENQRTRFSHGVTVPEADREAKPEKLHLSIKKAIPGIPLVDDEGNQVVEDDERHKD